MRARRSTLAIAALLTSLTVTSLSGCVITNLADPLAALSGNTPSPTPAPNAVAVTDEFGTYTRVTSAASDGTEALASDASASERARAWTVDFIMSQALDSVALDNATAWSNWVSDVAPDYFDARALRTLLKTAKRPVLSEPIIATAVNHLERNGGSRWTSTAITRGTTESVSGKGAAFVIRTEGTGVAPLESGVVDLHFTADYTVIAHGDGWRIAKWNCHWTVVLGTQ
jgi:hypothetical protein